MSARVGLRVLALLASGLLGACGGGSSDGARNLVLISIDTLRADALGSYGDERGASPFLDELATRGVRFASAWSSSPKTAPSHMTMLTGLPPRAHGVGNLNTAGAGRLGPRATTLGEILQARDFATAGFTDGGNAKGALGFDRGFDVFADKSEPFPEKAARVRRWLGGRGDERWFLFLHTYAVHDPYFPGAEAAARYVDPSYTGDVLGDRTALRARIDAGDDLAPNMEGHKKLLANYWRRVDGDAPADARRLHDLYTACLDELDAELRRLFGWMDEQGLLEDTLVVITSDHGEEFREHGEWRHEQMWREVLHVPLIVLRPGDRGAGGVVDGAVGHVDLVPSVLELLDVGDPRGVEVGESWAAALDAPGSLAARPVFAEHRSRTDRDLDLWAVRADGWLLHESRDGRSLHDLASDPAELEPVEDPARAAELEDRRRAHLAETLVLAGRFATGEGIAIDPELRAELEALGYLDGEDEE